MHFSYKKSYIWIKLRGIRLCLLLGIIPTFVMTKFYLRWHFLSRRPFRGITNPIWLALEGDKGGRGIIH